MNRHLVLTISLFAGIVGAFPDELRSQNVLINGSFEETALTEQEQPFLILEPGSTIIEGWSITRDSMKYVGDNWLAYDGDYSIDMDGNPGFGSIEQTFESVPGLSYRLQFRMAGNPNPDLWPPRVKRLEVRAAGASKEFFFDITGRTPTRMGWIHKRWIFAATEETTTLEFRSLDALGGNGGAAIDNVVLWPITASFLRGDSNNDGHVDFSDSIFTLIYLFLGGVEVDCHDAADFDDNGVLDFSDGTDPLQFFFLGNKSPAPPFPECGLDLTRDDHPECVYPLPFCIE